MEVGSVETIPARWAAGWGAPAKRTQGSGDIERARLKPVQRGWATGAAWYGIEAGAWPNTKNARTNPRREGGRECITAFGN